MLPLIKSIVCVLQLSYPRYQERKEKYMMMSLIQTWKSGGDLLYLQHYYNTDIVKAKLRWILRERLKKLNRKEMQVFSSLVGSLVPAWTPGLLRRSLVASCGCLTGTDALPALKCKIHSVVRLLTDLLSAVINP